MINDMNQNYGKRWRPNKQREIKEIIHNSCTKNNNKYEQSLSTEEQKREATREL